MPSWERIGRRIGVTTRVDARALNRQGAASVRLVLNGIVHKPSEKTQLRRAVCRVGADTRRRERLHLFKPVCVVPEAAYQLLVSAEPDPQYIVGFEDELERLLGILDPLQRQIAVLRLEGYSLPEIAERMKISLSSTQRKMKLVRETWACELDHGTIE